MKSQRNTTYNSGNQVNLFGGSTKPIPHSIEAEMSLLGAVMLGGSKTLAKVESIVPGGTYFYRQAHGFIYEAMKSVALNDDPIGFAEQQQGAIGLDGSGEVDLLPLAIGQVRRAEGGGSTLS